jgi:hypothetical protein
MAEASEEDLGSKWADVPMIVVVVTVVAQQLDFSQFYCK